MMDASLNGVIPAQVMFVVEPLQVPMLIWCKLFWTIFCELLIKIEILWKYRLQIFGHFIQKPAV